MVKHIAITLLACATMACGQVEKYLGKPSDITWTGSGTNFYGSFVTEQGWADPNLPYVFRQTHQFTNATAFIESGGDALGPYNSVNNPNMVTGVTRIPQTNSLGQIKYYGDYDGVDDYAQSAMSQSFSNSTGTIGMWLFIRNLGAADAPFCITKDASNTSYIRFTLLGSKGRVRLEIYKDGVEQFDGQTQDGDVYGATNRWAFFAIDQAGVQPAISIDGTNLVYSSSPGADHTVWLDDLMGADNPVDKLLLGKFTSTISLYPYEGGIDYFFISSSVLSTNEKQVIMANTIPTDDISVEESP